MHFRICRRPSGGWRARSRSLSGAWMGPRSVALGQSDQSRGRLAEGRAEFVALAREGTSGKRQNLSRTASSCVDGAVIAVVAVAVVDRDPDRSVTSRRIGAAARLHSGVEQAAAAQERERVDRPVSQPALTVSPLIALRARRHASRCRRGSCPPTEATSTFASASRTTSIASACRSASRRPQDRPVVSFRLKK